MAKSAMYDEELREKVRLKHKNDWSLDLNEDQVSMCIIEMEEQKLSIFHNQIWPNERNYKQQDGRGNWQTYKRVTWDKTIDGHRAIAHRTGRFAGVEKPEFDVDKDGKPITSRVKVYRIGNDGKRDVFIGEARYDEFVQTKEEWVNQQRTGKRIPNQKWADSPFNQLAIAAERQALRKAFQECDDGSIDITDTIAEHEPPEIDAPDLPEVSEETAKGSVIDPEDAAAEAPVERAETINGWKPGDLYEETPIVKVQADPNEASITWLQIDKTDGTYIIQLASDGNVIKRYKLKPEQKTVPEKKVEDSKPSEKPKQSEKIDIKSITDIDQLRNHCKPLLKTWCKAKNGGKKVSYKSALEHFTGVLVSSKMQADEYQALYDELVKATTA